MSIESGTKEKRKCKQTVKCIDNHKTIQRLTHHARERHSMYYVFLCKCGYKKGNMTGSWKRDFQAICETISFNRVPEIRVVLIRTSQKTDHDQRQKRQHSENIQISNLHH